MTTIPSRRSPSIRAYDEISDQKAFQARQGETSNVGARVSRPVENNQEDLRS
ncbi:hypothetical protein [Streptomyces sp. MBT33]|uniref:hypothetical protein n=1 Tax=Streptomyces sp. MBT33 TaxID=1488363 RepID=UPI00190DB6EA|nr:hypothetical protein [Streptomyces sp. MBT33]MBK3647672.1 hypothetical protein [Streptomyces sp. MBT33]